LRHGRYGVREGLAFATSGLCHLLDCRGEHQVCQKYRAPRREQGPSRGASAAQGIAIDEVVVHERSGLDDLHRQRGR
jgi:hypothetical protein